jgi:hypothetical protein
MKKIIAIYFGTPKRFWGWIVLVVIWGFLFGMEQWTGHQNNNGSSGYLLGVGLCWLVLS